MRPGQLRVRQRRLPDVDRLPLCVELQRVLVLVLQHHRPLRLQLLHVRDVRLVLGVLGDRRLALLPTHLRERQLRLLQPLALLLHRLQRGNRAVGHPVLLLDARTQVRRFLLRLPHFDHLRLPLHLDPHVLVQPGQHLRRRRTQHLVVQVRRRQLQHVHAAPLRAAACVLRHVPPEQQVPRQLLRHAGPLLRPHAPDEGKQLLAHLVVRQRTQVRLRERRVALVDLRRLHDERRVPLLRGRVGGQRLQQVRVHEPVQPHVGGQGGEAADVEEDGLHLARVLRRQRRRHLGLVGVRLREEVRGAVRPAKRRGPEGRRRLRHLEGDGLHVLHPRQPVLHAVLEEGLRQHTLEDALAEVVEAVLLQAPLPRAEVVDQREVLPRRHVLGSPGHHAAQLQHVREPLSLHEVEVVQRQARRARRPHVAGQRRHQQLVRRDAAQLRLRDQLGPPCLENVDLRRLSVLCLRLLLLLRLVLVLCTPRLRDAPLRRPQLPLHRLLEHRRGERRLCLLLLRLPVSQGFFLFLRRRRSGSSSGSNPPPPHLLRHAHPPPLLLRRARRCRLGFLPLHPSHAAAAEASLPAPRVVRREEGSRRHGASEACGRAEESKRGAGGSGGGSGVQGRRVARTGRRHAAAAPDGSDAAWMHFFFGGGCWGGSLSNEVQIL
eukprot:Rhum_TRINITY_DN12087_c1_g1::Rhum_TRINITY_DN12087_c1_g1_i1::g.48846::m.48846